MSRLESSTLLADPVTAFERTEAGPSCAAALALRWYLVLCKPREDSRALENLERRGFECYWPMRAEERRRDGRTYRVMGALFPRYLFVRLDSIHNKWHSIRSTRGVQQIVRCNDHPAPVSDAIIDAIRVMQSCPIAKEPYFDSRASLEDAEEASTQLEEIYVNCDGDERVTLFLNMLQKDQVFSFPLHSVQ